MRIPRKWARKKVRRAIRDMPHTLAKAAKAAKAAKQWRR